MSLSSRVPVDTLLTFIREYTTQYWPNKGIQPRELKNIHNKILAANKQLTGDASPEDNSQHNDHRESGSYKTSPP